MVPPLPGTHHNANTGSVTGHALASWPVTRVWGLLVALALWAGVACSTDDESGAPPPTSTAPPAASDVTMVTMNVLHGLSCDEGTDSCQAPDRLRLLWREIEAAGCPDLVGLTEIGPRQGELVPAELPSLCGGRYELIWDPVAQVQEFDRQMILSALPVLEHGYVDLAAFPWGAHWVKVQTGAGVVDFATTHFASSVNNPPCTPDICPPPCETGVETGTCHAVQLVEFLRERGTPGGTWIVTGDLNAEIDDPRLAPLLDAGYVDVWTLAGNPECDPATGEGCTCCIEPGDDGAGFRDPTMRRSERIDFILVRVDQPGCRAVLDGPDDPDGDGTGTGPFAFAAADPPVNGVLWPSDHSGVQADLTIDCS